MSGRPRNRKRKVPPYTYLGKGRWYHREYLGEGKLGREIKLAGPDATDEEIWKAYLRIVGVEREAGTLSWLFDEYFSSRYFARRAPGTQRNYKWQAGGIKSRKLRDGRTFGSVKITNITPGVIRRYMDQRVTEAPVGANRELTFLSVVFGYAVERDYLSSNPASSVKPEPEKPRSRYVTDEEYLAVYERSIGYLQLAMEFAYLCRLRKVEVIGPSPADLKPGGSQHTGILREHILDEGLRVIRSKGSKEQIIAWTPRLREAVETAKALPGVISTRYLLHNERGQRITVNAFNSAWRRVVERAIKETGIKRFNYHDLKAKGVSDFEGDKMKASGHKSLKMLAVYDRKIETVDPTK